ncbi:MAG: GNAT family N-acetyltransferase [Betaproteobacteria bacterium RIFCSPLOWO2_12_FULL_66_14]|nr:MAG: GNAT family N-acetyltransferase [Betaproteobacteria bacterium RIFCSPLOWO2_12_FULL_66_14]
MSSLIDRHYLTPLFEPSSVAIVGATEKPGKIGKVVIDNMLASGYRGPLYAVNPKYANVRGVPCFPDFSKIPGRVDLAVIATPPETLPEVIDTCGRAGVRGAVIITAGFSESGERGARLERLLLENARRHGVRLIGPNCLGVMRPEIGLNATFAGGGAIPGSMGLISQSGALCVAMLDWARPNGVGFSSVVSLGGSTDIDFGEIIDYLASDPKTEHILLYIEGIRHARRFVSALRAAARVKPVILMKVGRHPTGLRAAVSHTGAIVGTDDVFEAVVHRAGVVRVTTMTELVAAAQALSSRVRVRGDRLAIITNGGGPGVMAADRAGDLNVPLAQLSAPTLDALSAALPDNWSRGNPVDLIGDAGADRYRAAVNACLADTNVDGVLVILTPQAMTDPQEAACAVIEAARASDKPVITCWMGEDSVQQARTLFREARIPTFRAPEPAVDMFAHISSYYRNQRMLLQTPGPLSEQVAAPDLEGARLVIEGALAERRSVLSEIESKALLAAFHIPIARTVLARSAHEALLLAQETGFPVAMKIDSPDVTHKSDVGGVRLNIANAQAAREAYESIVASAAAAQPQARVRGVTVEPMVRRKNGRELMIGVLRDPVFGPAITFGAGGTAVEIVQDRTVALPPLNAFLAREMIGRTRVVRLLGRFRGLAPADLSAVEEALLRVSEMVCELPWIREMDINPLIADESGVVAVDARIVIDEPSPMRDRYGHMAIHPYPSRLVSQWHLPDGSSITQRPIRPEDAQLEVEFVRELSPESRYFRFMNTLRELTPQMLVRFTQIDYDREMALIAVLEREGREREIGVARYAANPDGETCEFAVVVADDWKRRGVGRKLMNQLIDVARARGFKAMVGHVLASNESMARLAAALGFTLSEVPGDPMVKRATLLLS